MDIQVHRDQYRKSLDRLCKGKTQVVRIPRPQSASYLIILSLHRIPRSKAFVGEQTHARAITARFPLLIKLDWTWPPYSLHMTSNITNITSEPWGKSGDGPRFYKTVESRPFHNRQPSLQSADRLVAAGEHLGWLLSVNAAMCGVFWFLLLTPAAQRSCHLGSLGGFSRF